MKNKTRKIIGVACGILLIILVQAIGVTYAKYLTVEKGKGSTEVAKWAFEISKDGEQTKTVSLADTVDKTTLVDGKIAPGTTGTIVITLDGTGSEVNLDYLLEFTNEQNKPKNITFTYKGTEYKSLSKIGPITGDISYDDAPQTRSIVVFWAWNYETGTTEDEISANDILDTEDANNIAQYTFDIIATGTQSK